MITSMYTPDISIPDPFVFDGYLGVIDRSAEREAETAHLRTGGFDVEQMNVPDGRVLASPDVARYGFPNGYGAGVLIGIPGHPACSIATSLSPHEMAIYHDGHLCYATPITNDTLCPLDNDAVRACLAQIATLPETVGCSHGR